MMKKVFGPDFFFYDLEFTYTFDLAHPECLRECITSQLKNSVLDSSFMYPDFYIKYKINTWSLRTESCCHLTILLEHQNHTFPGRAGYPKNAK